jgi:hypothetical protein
MVSNEIAVPAAPSVVADDASGEHRYALVAVGSQGKRTEASDPVTAAGLASLRWDSTPGADAYIVVRDGREYTSPLRIEGSVKAWTDNGR